VLGHPRWWVIGLAGFLVRGGLLVLLAVIVPIPTVAGLANILGPTLVGFVFGGPSLGFIVLVGIAAGIFLVMLLVGGLVGAWLDLALFREAGAVAAPIPDGEALALAPGEPPGDAPGDVSLHPEPFSAGTASRTMFVRLLAYLPTVAVLVWGFGRLVDQGYQELMRPGDPTVPVMVRVVLRVPEIVGLLLAAWVVGEVLGGLASRHLAAGAGLPRALARSIVGLLRPTGLVLLVLTDGAVFTAIALGAGALAVANGYARAALVDGAQGLAGPVALALLSAAWLGSFVLVGLAAAWRSVAWTFEMVRRTPGRTIEPPRA
jgi:hypothetical protein